VAATAAEGTKVAAMAAEDREDIKLILIIINPSEHLVP
jgi:hypothetical protein